MLRFSVILRVAGLGITAFTNGFFNGCMDQNSPYACFSGRGEVTVNQQIDVVVQPAIINELKC